MVLVITGTIFSKLLFYSDNVCHLLPSPIDIGVNTMEIINLGITFTVISRYTPEVCLELPRDLFQDELL